MRCVHTYACSIESTMIMKANNRTESTFFYLINYLCNRKSFILLHQNTFVWFALSIYDYNIVQYIAAHETQCQHIRPSTNVLRCKRLAFICVLLTRTIIKFDIFRSLFFDFTLFFRFQLCRYLFLFMYFSYWLLQLLDAHRL